MSRCPECHQLFGHHDRCPNYDDRNNKPRIMPKCDVCGRTITDNDEYIENENGDMAHWDCIEGKLHLLEFLGYDIKQMSNRYDYE